MPPPGSACHPGPSAATSNPAMTKRRLTAAQKAEKKRLREEYQWIFINGKQKRVRREPTIDGIPVDDFIRANADPIWLHQNELWEHMMPEDEEDEDGSVRERLEPK
jgi:hypothetical protein